MKKLVFIIFLIYSSFCLAQSYTERYNQGLGRYEYYNGNGILIGYKTYQSYNQTWKYTDLTTQNNPYSNKTLDYGKTINTQDVDLQGRVAIIKQERYNTNKAKIQNYADNIYSKFEGKMPTQTLNTMKSRFYNEVCLNLPRLDLSIDSNVNYIFKLMYDAAYKITIEEASKL